MMYTADRETGTFIEEVASISEGLSLIDSYEAEDKLENCYKHDFYDIVNEDHVSMLK